MSAQSEALRLADRLEGRWALHPEMQEAAAELRRLHEAHDWQYKMAGERLRRIENLEAQRDALLEALQALYDEQQGPPLIRHQAAWEAAMEKARAAIKAVEENK